MNSIQRFIRSGFVDDASSIVATFRQRVLADSGTFESEGYLINWLKQNRDLYNRSGFLLTPNGYKAGTLYAFKGQDYNTFTRAGNGTRINSAFGQELMTNNIPRIDYEHGTPTFLREELNTNIWHNNQTQTITVLSGQRYVLSFFGTGTVTVSGGLTATVVGISNTVKKIEKFGVNTSSTTVTLTVTGDVFWGNFVRGIGLEPTSHIPTVSTNVSRVSDVFNFLNLGVEMFNTPFAVFLEFYSNDFTGFADGEFLEIYKNNQNTILLRSDNLILTRLSNVLTSVSANPIIRQYGRRTRVLFHFDPATSNISRAVSYLVNGTWVIGSTTAENSPVISNVIATGVDSIRLGRGFSYKVKTFAILKDFTGISNIPAYMQALSLRPSI